tara:strand:- start:145 stop:345 length:201 start_codon:yes stop_codon:yes gene_type:complete
MKLDRMKGMYIGLSGDILLEYLKEKRDSALHNLLTTTDHIQMVKYQSAYSVYDTMISNKELANGKQ